MKMRTRNGSSWEFRAQRRGRRRRGGERDDDDDKPARKRRLRLPTTLHYLNLPRTIREDDVASSMDEGVDDAPRKLDLVLRHRLERVRFQRT